MGDIAYEIARKDGIMRITPTVRGECFPEFDEIEITPEGHVYGWAGKSKISTIESQYFGKFYNYTLNRPDVEVVSFNSKEVVLKEVG